MAAQLTLSIVTPEHEVVREAFDEVEVPGSEGYFGVLPGHTPLLATLGIGTLWYRQGSEKHYVAIAGGFAEVLPDRVTVLATVAERAEDVDVERARGAKARAEERLARPAADADHVRARAALARASARLDAASQSRARRS
jgi:F-type H+-transporting ATPase subunit epsilon